jgi:hypothetical protein
MKLQIQKLDEAYHRVHKMNKADRMGGFATPEDIGKDEIFLVALNALDAGIQMLQDGRTENGEQTLYEAAVYFIKFGETLEKI